jgi:dTDP-4-amino-4,6-dideoxygalactose transaminase
MANYQKFNSSGAQIPLFKVFMAPEEALMPKLKEVLYSGQISEGSLVQEFERKFSQFTRTTNVLSFYSGTAALHAALLLAGVQPGDDVISTAMTAEPTNMAIKHAGANIVWADIDSHNGNISAKSIAERITTKTRAIMVVHYGGIPASLNAIQKVAKTYGIPVIEDAAHALGASYAGQPLGSHSEYVMFSLQAIKHMTTVDGGMLVCKEKDDLRKGRLIRWFGIDRQEPRTEVDVQSIGYKYHMNNVTATIGLVQLDFISRVIERHIENGKFFDKALKGIPGIQLCRWDVEAEPSYWFYSVLAERRNDFSRLLFEYGISNSQVHKRNDLHSVFASSRVELPELDNFYSKIAHIPCGWWVTNEEREYMVDVIRKGW